VQLRPPTRLLFYSPAACFEPRHQYHIAQAVEDMENCVADSSANVIDFRAYRARKTAIRESSAPSGQVNFYQGAVYWFWPMMVWMPVPMDAAVLTNRDAL
jgi:hypothetical protein